VDRHIVYSKGSAKFLTLTSETWIIDHVATNFAKYNGPLSVVVDIGSHIGELAILAGTNGAKSIWAIEPDSENYRVLCFNIGLNSLYDKVIPLHLAIWQSAGVVSLKRPRKWLRRWGNTGQRSVMYKHLFPTTERIPAVTLPILLNWIGEPVDYLKIDIEGAEHNVLKSTDRKTLGSISYIDLELHNPQNKEYYEKTSATSHELLEYLRKCGFDVPEIEEGNILARNEKIVRGL